MQKFNEFIDLFKNNLIVEYNKNVLLKDRLAPLCKAYKMVSLGDRAISYYLDKVDFFINPSNTLPQFYGGVVEKKQVFNDKKQVFNEKKQVDTPSLPVKYSFSIKKFLANAFTGLKNIFFNSESSLKFQVEDEILPHVLEERNYTEKGAKDLKMIFLEHPLRDIRNIDYVGNHEFLFEVEDGNKKISLIKIKVEDDEGIKIDEISSTRDM